MTRHLSGEIHFHHFHENDFKLTNGDSINSIDELIASDDFNEQVPEVQRQDLADRIEELCERKGSSYKGREDSLAAFVRILTAHHLADSSMAELQTWFQH